MKNSVDIKPIKEIEKLVISHFIVKNSNRDTPITLYKTYKISILNTSGLSAVTKNGILNSNKGDVFFFAPDEIHFGRILYGKEQEFIDVYLPLSFLNAFNGFELKFIGRQNLFVIKEKGKIEEIYNVLLDCIYNKSKEKELLCFSKILELLFLCNENIEQIKGDSTPDKINKALAYISKHYSEKITLKELAKNSNCSITYLSNLFKKCTGTSIYNHIIEYRINIAKKLLSENKSVTDACYLCGFSDCSNFVNTFKKYTGVTPKQYKKQ